MERAASPRERLPDLSKRVKFLCRGEGECTDTAIPAISRSGSTRNIDGSNAQGLNRDNSRQTKANTSHRRVRHCAQTFDLITTLLALQTPLAEVLAVVA